MENRREFVRRAAAAACALGSPAASYGQPGRYSSPEAKTSVAIGGKSFSVDYYAPSMHGRKIMGALVPFGQVWCTGANIATAFQVGADIEIGKLRLPAGAYSIWTVPSEDKWTLIINRETGQFHLNYRESMDFGRTGMTLRRLDTPVETFRVELRAAGERDGVLALLWETTEAQVGFRLAGPGE